MLHSALIKSLFYFQANLSSLEQQVLKDKGKMWMLYPDAICRCKGNMQADGKGVCTASTVTKAISLGGFIHL